MKKILVLLCLCSTMCINTIFTQPSSAYSCPVEKDVAISYEEILHVALARCTSRVPESKKIELLNRLLKIEHRYSPPPDLRGMILAAACMESGFNPAAKGDRRFSRNGRSPKAIGILQQWPFYERVYGTNRLDPTSAAHGWMKHIVRMIPRVKKQCGYKSEKKIWVAAWVTGIRYKKSGGRCQETPKHWRLLRKWHREIRKERRKVCLPNNSTQ